VSNVKTKAAVTMVIKIIVLTFALLIIQAVASQIAGLSSSMQSQVDPAIAGQYALLTSFLFTIVLSYPIIRSKWSGWKLVLAIAVTAEVSCKDCCFHWIPVSQGEEGEGNGYSLSGCHGRPYEVV
jgi:hypothetical protein